MILFGKVLKTRFDGWKDETIRSKYFGSFSYYETEVAAGREKPPFPRGVYALRVRGREVEGIGTSEGTRVDVEYKPKEIDEEEIKAYLETLPAKLVYEGNT
ncbi:hypothetical protein EDM68_04020 [Candidatus Uhrbacteria bacterium]|nr:MAG: hypothetical protein EDM68_04020 [Candidatus Uhrbacteria bacterium]